ncbi:hypothetical protein GJ744_008285 [Endocarpon pusillum]|uniref:Bis(5'-adenosyl)-triphosphatase n=1 Tax=Endocarpon pusillum TaxID=364733 RepID=A0A8H7AQA7_9EURO|nr:hypothetical protein GJ744_008285 [Endocarpon pusillum]
MPPHQPQETDATGVIEEDEKSRETKEMISRVGPIRFGSFDVTSQVFHTTAHTFALVNLKPLLPGHILVCPLHHQPQIVNSARQPPPPPPSRLTQLSASQTTDLFHTVRRLTPTLTRLYSAQAFNIAIQDGAAAGQSVPHLHVHVIPRSEGDMDARGGGDRVYEVLEKGRRGSRCAFPSARRGERGRGRGRWWAKRKGEKVRGRFRAQAEERRGDAPRSGVVERGAGKGRHLQHSSGNNTRNIGGPARRTHHIRPRGNGMSVRKSVGLDILLVALELRLSFVLGNQYTTRW